MFIEAYLELSRTSTMELFFTLSQIKSILSQILNLIELPLRVPFFLQLTLSCKSLEL